MHQLTQNGCLVMTKKNKKDDKITRLLVEQLHLPLLIKIQKLFDNFCKPWESFLNVGYERKLQEPLQ